MRLIRSGGSTAKKTTLKTGGLKKSGLKTTTKSGTTKSDDKSAHNRASFVGAAGFEESKRAVQKAKDKSARNPYRYRLKQNEDGDVIILDAQPIFQYEHNWKGPRGYFDQFEICIKETSICPLCQKLGTEGYYLLALTVIDLRTYENKEGKRVSYTRKLYVSKSGMHDKWKRLYDKCKGNLRGVKLKIFRDGSDKSQASGNDFELLGRVKEEGLKKYVDKDKKPLEVFDYEKIWPDLSETDLRKMYGGNSPLGSEHGEDGGSDDEDLDNVSFDADLDDSEIPF